MSPGRRVPGGTITEIPKTGKCFLVPAQFPEHVVADLFRGPNTFPNADLADLAAQVGVIGIDNFKVGTTEVIPALDPGRADSGPPGIRGKQRAIDKDLKSVFANDSGDMCPSVQGQYVGDVDHVLLVRCDFFELKSGGCASVMK